MSFSVVSYNVLADAYLRPEWYPNTPAPVLDPDRRRPALVQRIANLAADVVCLQEVEADFFGDVAARLRPAGYEAHYVQKLGKPDGCATLVRANAFTVRGVRVLHYADGSGAKLTSGHVALFVLLEQDHRPLAIANTHLKWDPPGTPVAEQWGHRQATELLESRAAIAPQCRSWIIAGDFNATADSAVVQVVREHGFVDAYGDHAAAFTCNSNRCAKRIDYLLHTPDLRSRPGVVPAIDDRTLLPSVEEPSDHLAVMASFDWCLGIRVDSAVD